MLATAESVDVLRVDQETV